MAQKISQTPEGKTYAVISLDDAKVLNSDPSLIKGDTSKVETPKNDKQSSREFGLYGEPNDVMGTLNNLNRKKAEQSRLNNAAKRTQNLDDDY